MLKKKDALLEQLHELTATIDEAAHYFHSHKETVISVESRKVFTDTIKAFEKKADGIIQRLIIDLNAHYITPLEREDLLNLAIKIDDILDGLDTCVSHFDMFGMDRIDAVMSKFGELIVKSTSELLKAITLLTEKKFNAIGEYAVRINEIESEADTLLRESIRNLFHSSNNPIYILRYKEMYEILEQVTDSCEDVADALELIIMKNS